MPAIYRRVAWLLGLAALFSWEPAAAGDALPPDSLRIAFVCGSDEIWTVGASGQTPTKIIKADDAIWAPVWSPDGSQLAFFSVHRRGWAKVMAVDVASGAGKVLGKFDPTFAVDGMTIVPLAWSKAGDSLYVADKEGTHRVASTGDTANTVLVAPVPAKQELAPEWQEILGEKNAVGPVPAPGDSTVAFGVGKQLVLVGPGGKRRDIHEAHEPISWIKWLPGGDKILCLSGPIPTATMMPTVEAEDDLFPGRIELVAIDPNGGDPVVLQEWTGRLGPRQAYPALSPDGSALALISSDDELMLVSTDGTRKTKIFTKERCRFPVWQPSAR